MFSELVCLLLFFTAPLLVDGQCGCSACGSSSPANTRFCPAGGCSISIINGAIQSCSCSAGGGSCFTSASSCGTAPSSQVALPSGSVSTGFVGFIQTATVTFCTSTTSEVFLSGDTTLSGTLNVDDMLVYKSDANPVVGLGFFSSVCSTSGFLTIASSSVTAYSTTGNGPAFSIGTLSPGSHTLQIGTYNCGGAGINSQINVVSCALTPCSSTTTASSTTTPASSKTVWSGSYTINAGCDQTQCCCAVGSFTMTQVGTQVSGTVSVAGQCNGATTAPFAVTLSSSTATSGTWGQNNLVKNGATVTATNTANAACSATLTCTSGDCLPQGTMCFHASTVITYGEKQFGMADIQILEPECRIPHVVTSTQGVVLTLDCPSSSSSGLPTKRELRLTRDHLVFTASGLKEAGSLIPHSDVVYADLKESHACTVLKVEQEKEPQTYFGLNCHESVVLANGIKTSTFGRYHWLPAAWMKYGSKILGIDRASSLGDTVASFFGRLGLL